jgi:hypothetical protein
MQWATLWAIFFTSPSGHPAYIQANPHTKKQVDPNAKNTLILLISFGCISGIMDLYGDL